MSKPFKVGIIGTGGIAGAHVSGLKKVEGVEIVAGADINPKALEKAKKEWGIGRLFDDHKKMLREMPEIDAICVCTPNGGHCEHAVNALRAGKHVLVEKPMAMNAKEGQKMVDAAKAAKKHLVIGFQHRFAPNSKAIRQQLVAGELGKICYVRCQALRRRGIPNWGVFGRKELQGGGPMIDIGVHILETAHYLIGSPKPIAATGNCFTYMGNKPCAASCSWPNWDYKTYTVEDLAVGMIRFDNGAMLTIEASFATHIPQDVWNVQILGEKGGAVWDPPQLLQDRNGYMFNATPAHVGQWDVFEVKMKHFVEVCRDGRTNDAPAEHGLMVQKMLDGVYASAAAGKEVAIR